MENINIEELEKEYVKLIFDIRLNMIAVESYTDEEIQKKIAETPVIIKLRDRSSGSNLFVEAVSYGRMELAKYLAEQGADIYYESSSDWVQGNALNAAETPEMVEWLLSLGLKIEKNLTLKKPLNPAVVHALHEQPEMMRYWLTKEKELFADDSDYVKKLFSKTIDVAACHNSGDFLSVIISDDELYPYLKANYSEEDWWDPKQSIKLHKHGLRMVVAEDLQERKKELNKILNQRAKEL